MRHGYRNTFRNVPKGHVGLWGGEITHACARARTRTLARGRAQALLELYDRMGHSKRIGFKYSRNTVTDVVPGLQAEREGVSMGWRIGEV